MKLKTTLAALLFCATALASSPHKYRLVWQDDFNGTTFDSRSWTKIKRGAPDWRKYMSDADSLYAVRDGKLVSTEGDPDFPVNEGALCAKGAALFSMYTNPHRLTKPLYRAPYSEKWEEKDWGWMLEKIARRVKDTRDKDLILKNSKGQTVNRLESIFMMGTSHASNEECAVIHQAMRGLGVVQMDHQARV